MRGGAGIAFCLVLAWGVPWVVAQTVPVRTTYHVKQIATVAVYLGGGSEDGLKEGMHLKVSRLTPSAAQMSTQDVGDINIVAVATISAVCEIKDGAKPIEVGDTAEL